MAGDNYRRCGGGRRPVARMLRYVVMSCVGFDEDENQDSRNNAESYRKGV